ncbi:MAG: hypothetical protein AMJ69_05085 [Gammaproteobacteria bacterium SG8_47]|nr:MAG: hypothetical protein AMJ69_05085 [Gammaproteobacteria bacterium SG8_47]
MAHKRQSLSGESFLPNFCAIRMVFAVVIVAQLLSFLFALVPLRPGSDEQWSNLGLISLFVQWIALTSAALLCSLRRWLARLSQIQAGLLSYAILLGVIGAISEATFWVWQLSGAALDSSWHLHFLLRNLVAGAIISGLVLRYFYVQYQWKRNVQAESEARLQALQARIRPHFLFNSMNTIASLTRSQPDQAEGAVEDLADLFRMSLSDARKLITLEEELALCQRYLHIEGLRLGERLAISCETEALPGDALVPPLILQPLVENAVYHGIEPRAQGGRVEISGARKGSQLTITIRNPLPPSSEGGRARNGNRIAQDNVRERLAAHYGPDGRLELSMENDHYDVTMTLPYRTQQDEGSNR